MIELTEQQMEAMDEPTTIPPRVVNPRTKELFVLVRMDEYERLKKEEYDDSDWTRAELQTLAWQIGEHTGWEEYDDPVRRLRRKGQHAGRRRGDQESDYGR